MQCNTIYGNKNVVLAADASHLPGSLYVHSQQRLAIAVHGALETPYLLKLCKAYRLRKGGREGETH